MATVTFDKATRRYAEAGRPAVDGLDLHVADGEFVVLVGPSGCGKSTSLRMLAGLEDVDAGAIRIGDRDVTAVPPKSRDIAMVFQNYALYPHLSVADNMAFALKMAGVAVSERASRVAAAAKLLDLSDYLDRKPSALSGGQRQRVAMGRAIVREPQVFLMDEPLSNLDSKLRVSTRTQIASLQRRLGVTTVYVTHDQVEAMTMGDRVAVLKDGVLQQVDSPLALYDRPANVFVAGFVGSPAMNLFPASLSAEGAVVGGFTLPLDRDVLARANGSAAVTIGIRPEAFRLVGGIGDGDGGAGDGDADGLAVTVDVVEELGADAFVYATADLSDGPVQLVARHGMRRPPARGAQVRLAVNPDQVHVFDARTGDRLSSAPAAR